ncbi:hypothetical protein [Oryza sativa Japonica Group]|uniref:Uncharacterized protein P0022F12.17 n=1 Tax=Oryza sativa subsp. japonica TaxID=39947 RepID=Q657A9_ORYSJ|nr:hypothetical protein [Oryza sativa Japonica Group]
MGRDKVQALHLKVIIIFCILTGTAVGAALPSLGGMFPAIQPESDVFIYVKTFATGVILAAGPCAHLAHGLRGSQLLGCHHLPPTSDKSVGYTINKGTSFSIRSPSTRALSINTNPEQGVPTAPVLTVIYYDLRTVNNTPTLNLCSSRVKAMDSTTKL